MGSSLEYVKIRDLDDVLLLEPASSGIKIHHLGNPTSLSESEVTNMLVLLAGGSSYLDLDVSVMSLYARTATRYAPRHRVVCFQCVLTSSNRNEGLDPSGYSTP